VGPDGNLYFSADSICPAEGIAGFCPQGGTVWKLGLAQASDTGATTNGQRVMGTALYLRDPDFPRS